MESSDVIVVKNKSLEEVFRYSHVLTCIKKDNIVSSRAPGYTNRADQNSNVITLVKIIIMLL